MPSDKAMRNWPWKPLAAAFTLSRACCKAVKMRGTCSRNSLPARVRRVLRLVRTNNCSPRSSSSSLMVRDSVRLLDVQPLGGAGEVQFFGNS